jgi:transposase
MYSIGLDIGKSSIAVHIPKNSLDLEIENSAKALKSLYAKLKKIYKKEFEKLIWVFESTGSYSSLLYRFCADKKISIFMPNPKQARGFAKAIAQRNKSDKIDARVLSQSIMIAKEGEIKVPTVDPLVEHFKEMIGYYRLLVKQANQLKNHQEALTAKRASKTIILLVPIRPRWECIREPKLPKPLHLNQTINTLIIPFSSPSSSMGMHTAI